ncbi:MAG: hypothetical protein E5299_00651 [Burkholderia gladioli]|nr:MAG: hypothetical protein E5299_00651 [Burkholderia gladioli]
MMKSREEDTPLPMMSMGGQINARQSPISVNSLATNHSLIWTQ